MKISNSNGFLVGCILFGLNVLPSFSLAQPLTCPEIFNPSIHTKSKPLTGSQLRNFNKQAIKPPLDDYRLFIYPKNIWNSLESHAYKEQSIEVLTRSQKESITYIHSIRNGEYPADVAIFSSKSGDVFGISHVELFEGNLTLTNFSHSLFILESIADLVKLKKTDSSLDKMFAKKGNGFWRFNARNSAEKRIKQQIPFLSDASLKIYTFQDKPNSRLALRSYKANNLKIEITEVLNADLVDHLPLGEGSSLHKKIITEILDFIFPLYAERRGWSPEFISSLKEKAFESAASTKYIVIRDIASNNIIASMGLSRAPYGKAIIRDTADWKWKEVLGSFGSTIKLDGLGPLLPRWEALDTPVPTLPMENTLGELRLPRPMVLEVMAKYYQNQKYSFGEKPFNNSIEPSAFDPVFAGSGIIYEPTKFAVAKNTPASKVAHAIILKELFSAVFDLRYKSEFLKNGQYLYTYNDRKGTRLYQRMGFEILSQIPAIKKDGSEWFVLGLSPEKIISMIEKNYFQSNEAFEEFAKEIENHIGILNEQLNYP